MRTAAHRAFAALALLLACAPPLAAHQPDKMDHNTTLRLRADGTVEVIFQIWVGRLVAHRLLRQDIDRDADLRVSEAERRSYALSVAEKASPGLELRVNRRPVPLLLANAETFFEEGPRVVPQNLFTILTLRPASDRRRFGRRLHLVTFRDRVPIPAPLQGNNIIKIEPDEGLRVYKTRFPRTGEAVTGAEFFLAPSSLVLPESFLSRSGGLGPLDSSAVFPVPPAPDAAPPRAGEDGEGPAQEAEEEKKGGDGTYSRLLSLFHDETARFWAVLAALGLAVLWGASHALSPGHGKALVAGYLVGTKGRFRDAAFLGLVVTLTHVSSVLLLGLLMWAFAGFFRQETVFPVTQALSGAIIFVFGLFLFARRSTDHVHGPGGHTHGPIGHVHVHDHGHGHPHDHGPVYSHSHEEGHDHGQEDGRADHPHDHGHAHDQAVPAAIAAGKDPQKLGKWEMLLLGVTGGMVPCPTAIAILLAFFGLGLAGVGFLVVLAFSIGLAGVLIGLGMAMVAARSFAVRSGRSTRHLEALLPKLSGFAVCLVGLAILIIGLDALGVLTLHVGREWVSFFT